MPKRKIPLSSLESFPDPTTEDDVIDRIDAQQEAKKLFQSEGVTDKQKVVLALRHNMFPVELKEVKVRTKYGQKTIGELANALPDNTRNVTLDDIGDVFGVTNSRVHQLEQDGFRAARGIVNPPPARRRWR